MNRISSASLDHAFHALAAFLEDAGAKPERFVLIGCSALIALGLISRTTRDADIMAGVDAARGLVDPRPLSQALQAAAYKVARELNLDENWLNTGPADQLRAGLPDGFRDRLTARHYGPCLTVYLPDRFDLLHFKLHAAVDQGAGRHTSDLLALHPTGTELLAAAHWVLTQDAGEVFPAIVRSTLNQLGHESVARQI